MCIIPGNELNSPRLPTSHCVVFSSFFKLKPNYYSTIGTGEIIPERTLSSTSPTESRKRIVFIVIYILGGMALIAMSFNSSKCFHFFPFSLSHYLHHSFFRSLSLSLTIFFLFVFFPLSIFLKKKQTGNGYGLHF